MLPRLLLLFTSVPLLELVLLVYLKQQTSWTFTIGLVLATGAVGAVLMKFQGLLVWRRMGEKLRTGEAPTDALLDGLMILGAGCLLLTPGILTDVLGFSLLLPPVRSMIRNRVRDRVVGGFKQQMSGGSWTMHGSWASDDQADQHMSNDGDTIIEARVIEEETPRIEGDNQRSTE